MKNKKETGLDFIVDKLATPLKTRKTELDVDFIGGLGSLTIEQKKAISAYLKSRKLALKNTPKDSK